MKKPISNPEFWKQRLEAAKAMNNLRNAVYITSDKDWEFIDRTHQAILNKHIGGEDTVLDAGCGYGRASTFFPGKFYLGIDSSEHLIATAKKLYPEKEFILGDLNDIDVPDDSFDWVVCISIQAMIIKNLDYNNWALIQEELLRVSKNGVLCLEYGQTDILTEPSTYSLLLDL